MSCSKDAFDLINAQLRNAVLFGMYGTREKADVPMYTCTACGKRVSISGSVSTQGRDLVCNACALDGRGPDWVGELARFIRECPC